jgi:hypothetical protein
MTSPTAAATSTPVSFTSAVLLFASLPSPGPGFQAFIYPTSTSSATLFLGSNASVSASHGMQVLLGQVICVPVTPAVYAITGTGTATVWFWWAWGGGGLYIAPGQLT